MFSKKIISLALALVIVMSMALTGCADKTTDTENNVEEPTTETNTVTASTEEDVAKLVNDFYAGLADVNPIQMDSLSDGSLISVFVRDGDKVSSSNPDQNFTYYCFIEDGVKYYIADGSTAYASDDMYDMINEGLSNSLKMFVTGIFSAEAESTPTDAEYTYSAEQSDNKLTYTVDTVIDGVAEKVTVTGTKDAEGRVTDIVFDHTTGEETGNFEMKFTYDDISVELPEYTIASNDTPAVVGETSHVESTYATLQELIDTLDEDRGLIYVMQDDYLYAFGAKDGRYYQFRASFPIEDRGEFDALSVEDVDYAEKQFAILGALAIDDCIDFTDCVESPDELASYAGMTVAEMIDAGFESSGWSVGGGQGNVYLTKNLMNYSASITIPEGVDEDSVEEFEDLYECVIVDVTFEEPEYAAMPIE